MIKLGTIDGKDYGVDASSQLLFGEIKAYTKDQKDPKGNVTFEKGELYINSPVFPSTLGYAVELFVKVYQVHKVKSIPNGNLQDLCDIINKSNEIRKELLEKIK